jgi:hypothetical protein
MIVFHNPLGNQDLARMAVGPKSAFSKLIIPWFSVRIRAGPITYGDSFSPAYRKPTTTHQRGERRGDRTHAVRPGRFLVSGVCEWYDSLHHPVSRSSSGAVAIIGNRFDEYRNMHDCFPPPSTFAVCSRGLHSAASSSACIDPAHLGIRSSGP